LFQKVADIRSSPGQIVWQFIWPESKWFQGVLLEIDVAELHAALINTLNPNDKLVTGQFQDQEITFMDRSGTNQSFPISNVHRADGQLLNGLLKRQHFSNNRQRILLSRRTHRRRMFGDRGKTLEFASNCDPERIGVAAMGQQLTVFQGDLLVCFTHMIDNGIGIRRRNRGCFTIALNWISWSRCCQREGDSRADQR
jgi:hypothetical protein